MANELTGNWRIAPTAYYTAQAWVRAGFPNAEIFDTWMGRVAFGASERAQRTFGALLPPVARHEQEHLYVRHFVHEVRLRQLAPELILEVGAGLSPRGLSFARDDPKLVYVEVDLPGMVAAKRAHLAKARVALPPNYFLGTADILASDFLGALPARPDAGQRTAIVTEGVTDYLSMDEKRVAFANLAGVLRAAGGGTYQTDLYTRDRLASTWGLADLFISMLGLVVGRRFDDRLFASAEDAIAFLCEHGFDSGRVLDAESLNPGPYHPPMDACPWQLIEARVDPIHSASKKTFSSP